jgi:predicted glycoside hydrolase/deacetylase ChbG (UPF0249 family)
MAAAPLSLEWPPNLRVNADDFGLAPGISRAILDAARAGEVNSVSVVPFQDRESKESFAHLAALPGVRIGAHLTFLEVPLLTRPARFPDGSPPADYRAFLGAWLRREIPAAAVYAEWTAQLIRLADRLGEGRASSHLDSHQHIHLLPGLWEVACRLRAELSIPVIRVPWEGTLRAWRKDPPFGAALQTLAWARRRASVEGCFGVATSMRFQAGANRAFAARVARETDRGFELMIHPDESDRGRREMEELRRWHGLLRAALHPPP